MGGARACCLGLLALASCGRYGFTSTDDPTGDGGRLGDGRRDGTGDGGGNGLCPAFATFCEDFESGSLSQWPMSEIVGPSSTMITTVRPHTGTRALESQTQPSGGSGVAGVIAPIGTHSTGMLAARVWINATVAVENFDLVLSLGDAQNNNYTTVGGDGFANWVVSEARTTSGTTDSSSVTLTHANQWQCVELVFTFGGTPHFDVFVDNAQVLSMNAIPPSPTYNTIRVGAVRSDNLGFHIFTDDVAVATQRLGCN